MRTPHSRRTASRHTAYAITALVGLAIAAPALADWPPTYTIERIGLQGPDYDAPSIFQHDFIRVILDSGSAVGETKRDNGGTDIWLWDGQTHLLGLTDAEHTGSSGLRSSQYRSANSSGQILGLTSRILGIDTNNGNESWVWHNNSTIPLGLFGPQFIGSAGYRLSAAFLQNEAGQIAGHTQRILDVNTSNGYDAWVWNDGVTQQIGLLAGIYEGSAGYRSNFPHFQSQSNRITGTARRVADVNTDLGQDTWIWNAGATEQIGLTGGVFTDSNNYQFSRPLLLNDAGFVAGYSTRYDESLADFGQSAWVWDGSTTRQIGLTGAEHTGVTGYQTSVPTILTMSGLVGGISLRVLDLNTSNGYDAWLWDGTSTRQLGPTGPDYTGSAGYRSAQLFDISETGRVIGRTQRITGENTDNGGDLWVSQGDSLQLLGLFGPEYTGASGYRLSFVAALPDTGEIAGGSKRILGENTDNGDDWWVRDGSTITIVGLTGPEYTGSNGYRKNTGTSVWHESAQGKVRGETWRITGVNTQNGKDVWWYDGATTHLLGLTGPEYTGSNGYRNSSIFMQNAANQIVGTTSRIINVSSQVSTIAWYFDPATDVTTPIIASVGPEGTYPSSSAGYLTDDGYLLGSFTYFVPGTSATESHAYVFRPDIGIIDVSTHIEGGVATNGWRSVGGIFGAVSYHTIFGHASRFGADYGPRAFVLRAPIEPACPICPADYDQDGGVSGSDIAGFFSDFEQGAACADVDLDGGVTGADLSTFFASYEAGGC